MAISDTQAKMLTGVYSSVRQMGLLKSRPGQRLFTSLYFLYKKYLEDPFGALAKRRPELFRGGHVLDIGANIGYTAVVFAAPSTPDTKFMHSSQSHSISGCWNERLRPTSQFCVIPVRSAVGQKDGGIELWLNDHHHADHRIAVGDLNAAERDGRT